MTAQGTALPPCPACGGGSADALPVPVADRAMLSDGRVLPVSLDKLRCPGCGLVRHRRRLDPEEVRAIYADGYSLPQMTGAAESARGRIYAHTIVQALGRFAAGSRLLDVGCGSGAMLRALFDMEPAVSLVGIDPAFPSPETLDGGRLRLLRGLPERDLAGGAMVFDAVVSINTIEHAASPVAFLSGLRGLLRPGGGLVVICPAAMPANNELLFHDHLWTIPPAAMARFAAAAGLRVRMHRFLEGALAGFQLFRLVPSDDAVQLMLDDGFWDCGVAGDAAAYLDAWRALDGWLMREIEARPLPVQMFGAGQMAALLRAYAPGAWARVERLVLDRPEDAWPLDRLPVLRYDGAGCAQGWTTILGAHPAAQATLTARIRADGGVPLALPEAIRC